METTGSITDLDTIGKADLNEKLHHFYGEAKPKHLEKRAKNMPNEHASVYHKNTGDHQFQLSPCVWLPETNPYVPSFSRLNPQLCCFCEIQYRVLCEIV
jgi:hypothetical protein